MYLGELQLYIEANCMQRQDAEDTLNEFADKIKWLPGGGDSMLHIGSREGDILLDYVFPLLPKNFRRLVGIDNSDAMISYAVQNYRHPKLFFELADIVDSVDVNKILYKFGQFDHVTTLFSLQGVKDQELAFRNIFDLLTPHGDVLITMCVSHPLYEHYKEMIASEKWSSYRKQMKLSTSPYFNCPYPVKMLEEILKKVGFENVQVEMKKRLFNYDEQVFIDSTSAIAPLLRHVPENLRTEFLSTYESKVRAMSDKGNKMLNSWNIGIPYRMLVAYAKKGNYTDHNNNSIHPQVVLKDDEIRMHNARSYHASNCMQRKDAIDTINEYENVLQWSPIGDDSLLLDIGAGSGDVTFDYILPMLPQKTQIIASDKSLEMLDYAKLNFQHRRITYEELDIENKNHVDDMLQKYGQFHNITSFCCLHWALKQNLVMANIFDLLKPGGHSLMTIFQHHAMYEHYADMCVLPKWSKYEPDMKKSTSVFFGKENPEKELYMRLERAGFVDINVELKRRIFHYDNQVFIDSTFPVAPFLDKISASLKDEFLQIYINKVMTMQLPAPYKSNNERNDGKTIIPFCMLVAHARKPN